MAPGSKKKEGVKWSDRNPRSLARGRPPMRRGGRLLFLMRAAIARGCRNKRKKGVKGSNTTAKLPDDILADIISRLASKSVCRCKCVCTRWRDLVTHLDHRIKMQQPLAGFFHRGYRYRAERSRHFTNVSGEGDPLVDVSLPFLPKYDCLGVLDCCNGLLLCRCQSWKPAEREILVCYVVCNPATEKWVTVPASEWTDKGQIARLGFDPAVSSHFHVYEFIHGFVSDAEEEEFGCIIERLATYSSKAGIWTHRSVAEHNSFAIRDRSSSVFLNRVLYLAALGDMVLAVDVEGSDWRLIRNPQPQHDSRWNPYNVFPSQGRLYLAQGNTGHICSKLLSVWVLEDCCAGKWTLKHNVRNVQIFGKDNLPLQDDYTVVSFHPEHDIVFIVCVHENLLVSYEMGCGKLTSIRRLDRSCYVYDHGRTPFLTYVPLLSESLADQR